MMPTTVLLVMLDSKLQCFNTATLDCSMQKAELILVLCPQVGTLFDQNLGDKRCQLGVLIKVHEN